ncbi:hypothetical protein NLO95_28395 [Pseudomonas syringae]|nr:hypothetical protein [Pseudomonas syringae]
MDVDTRFTLPRAEPAITGVVDSQNNPIPNNGTTEDNVLTLSGTGTADTGVIIADNNAPIALALVDEQGEWMKSVAALEGRHSYTIRFSDEAWVVTVVAALAPVITHVRDSSGEVVDGGSTFDTAVTLEGTAAPDQQVEILDRAELLATATATDGHWTVDLSSLAFKGYSVQARGLYGSLPESVVRTFNVIYAGEDFETGTLGVIPANTPQEFPSMFVTSKDKDASLIADSIAAPIVADKAVSFADDSSVRFELKSPVNKITFGVFAKASGFDVEMPYLACLDEKGALIFERKLEFGSDFAAWQEVSSPDRRIKVLLVTVNPGTDWFYVDNFSFA